MEDLFAIEFVLKVLEVFHSLRDGVFPVEDVHCERVILAVAAQAFFPGQADHVPEFRPVAPGRACRVEENEAMS